MYPRAQEDYIAFLEDNQLADVLNVDDLKENYVKLQLAFDQDLLLEDDAKKHLVVRLYSDCHGRDQKLFWNESIHGITFDNNHSMYEN